MAVKVKTMAKAAVSGGIGAVVDLVLQEGSSGTGSAGGEQPGGEAGYIASGYISRHVFGVGLFVQCLFAFSCNEDAHGVLSFLSVRSE